MQTDAYYGRLSSTLRGVNEPLLYEPIFPRGITDMVVIRGGGPAENVYSCAQLMRWLRAQRSNPLTREPVRIEDLDIVVSGQLTRASFLGTLRLLVREG